MPKSTGLLIAGALSGILGACMPVDPTIMDTADFHYSDLDSVRQMAPQGTAFSQGLRAGYLAEADAERDSNDFGSYDHFARKAVASAKGLNVGPDELALREALSEIQVSELSAARARLLAGRDGEGRRKAPLAMARAQVAFDCWLEQSEENDTNDIERCKSAFENAMADVEAALASDVDNVYVVFFNWDDSVISPVAQTIIDNVVADYNQGEAARIIVAGHADTSGSEGYNDQLSEQRALSVEGALVSGGVDSDAIDVEWFGEMQPRVATADGVREAQNRRVEIRFDGP